MKKRFAAKKRIISLCTVFLALAVCFVCPACFAANKTQASKINMNFDDVTLSSFVKVMSKTLGTNIVADPSVANVKISVIADNVVSVKEAREIMLSVFEMNNLCTLDMGGYTTVLSAGSGKVIGVEETLNSDSNFAYIQQQEELRKNEERLHTIKSYMSSPIIPFDAHDVSAALKIGKTGTTENSNSDKKTDTTKRTATSWNRFIQLKKTNNENFGIINSGTVISAMLISGINSDLPGNMVAQVSSNVYDSVTGKHLLIPQGSRLFGIYDSKVLFGQRRPLIKWTRLIYPNGATLDLENMPGADTRGYAGFKAKVNNHYWPMVSNAALVSVFAAVATYYDNNRFVVNSPTINLGASNVPIGSVVIWTNSSIPDGWLLCDGREFDTTAYSDLKSALGKDTLPAYDNSDPQKQWIIKATDSTSSIASIIASVGSSTTSSTYNVGSTVGRELGRTLEDMASKVLSKYLDIAPTLTVKPGYKFIVIVNKEVILPIKNNFHSFRPIVYEKEAA